MFVGEVEDLQLDMNAERVTGLALGEINRELFGARVDGSRGILVPYRWVRAVGDVVLVNNAVEQIKGTDD